MQQNSRTHQWAMMNISSSSLAICDGRPRGSVSVFRRHVHNGIRQPIRGAWVQRSTIFRTRPCVWECYCSARRCRTRPWSPGSAAGLPPQGAAPPSPSSRRFNTDGEGASAKLHLQRPDGVEVLLEPVHHALESEEPPRTEWFSAMLLKRVTPPG